MLPKSDVAEIKNPLKEMPHVPQSTSDRKFWEEYTPDFVL